MNTKLPGSALILAGGQSRRMGQDKAELPWGHVTLLDHAVEQMAALFQDVVVVSGSKRRVVPGTRSVEDGGLGLGPLAGLRAGLEAAAFPWTFVMACDMPLVEPALVSFLWSLREKSCQAVIPVASGKTQPFCSCYSREALAAASSLLDAGRRSMEGLLDRLPVRWVTASEMKPWDPSLRSFTNVNTPEEFTAVKEASYG